MIDFSDWKYYKDVLNQNIGITKTNQDGSVSMILLTDPNVAKWLEEGNVPEPAEGAE